MSEGLHVVALGLGFLIIFTALGLGPACVLGRASAERLLLAPMLGLAIAASVLTTASLVLPMRVAAWVVLVPAALLSLALAFWKLRRRRQIGSAKTAIPLVLVVAGLLLASAPALERGTAGPFGINVFDAWGYVQADLWLQGHTLRDEPAADDARWDLSLVYGHALTGDNNRIGVSVVNASVASLFGDRPDETSFAFLAALFALMPAVIWTLARELGAGRAAAAFGACFGLSAAVFTLVGDSALANLSALVLAPGALVLLLRGLGRGETGDVLLAAILLAGLISVYPEFIAPFAVMVALGAAFYVVRWGVSTRSWARARAFLFGFAVLGAGVAALAPVSLYRGLAYLSRIRGDSPLYSGLPRRFMNLDNSGAWAFGVLHVYQLQTFDLLSGPKTAIAVAVPLALAALIAAGALLGRRAALVLIPIGVPIVLGLLAYRRYQSGHCEYCLWKSLTLMLPFLGAGIALGAGAVWREARWGSSIRLALRSAVVVLGLVALGVLARTDVKVARIIEHSPAAGSASLRKLEAANVSLPKDAQVLVEGAEASGVPKWTVPEAYYAARGLHGARPSLPLVREDAAYLGVAAGASTSGQYYAPSYEYVLSSFPGVRSGRTLLAERGTYALYRRAPIDVAIVGANMAIDPAEGTRAIPWLISPLQLWISARQPRRVGVLLRLRHGEAERPLLELTHRGRPLPTFSSDDRSQVCADMTLDQGLTVLTADPAFASPPSPGIATEDRPIPPPPKLLGISGVEILPGGCPSPFRTGVLFLVFGAGWQGPERDAKGGVFRWMGSRADLTIGGRNEARPALRLTATLTSLIRPRLLTVLINGTTIRRIRVPPLNRGSRQVALVIPAGRGPARLFLTADPGAQSASAVTPGDTRMLAIAFSGVTLSRA